MAVIDNTITTTQLCTALDVEASLNFDQSVNKLVEILGIVSPEIIAAGTALYQYKVTGNLNNQDVAEGDETPLSQYEVEKVPIGEIEFKPYRKMTTAQAVLKSGMDNAIRKTDRKMIGDVRANIIKKFFDFLQTGTGTAEGVGLQGAFAQVDATLNDALEKNNDSTDRIIHFINPFDQANYLSDALVVSQNAFGMTYLESFLGVENVFVTNRVEQGKIIATPAENIHLYGVDFGALSQAGLTYAVQDGSLIGVHHEPNYVRNSAETYIATGATLLAEILDYIVIGEIKDATAKMSVAAKTAATK